MHDKICVGRTTGLRPASLRLFPGVFYVALNLSHYRASARFIETDVFNVFIDIISMSHYRASARFIETSAERSLFCSFQVALPGFGPLH